MTSKERVSQDMDEKKSTVMGVSPASCSIREAVALLEEKLLPVKTCSDMAGGNETGVGKEGGVGGEIDNGSQWMLSSTPTVTNSWDCDRDDSDEDGDDPPPPEGDISW